MTVCVPSPLTWRPPHKSAHCSSRTPPPRTPKQPAHLGSPTPAPPLTKKPALGQVHDETLRPVRVGSLGTLWPHSPAARHPKVDIWGGTSRETPGTMVPV